MSSKKNNNNVALKELEQKLKNAHTLNYILIAVCAVLLVLCIVFAVSSCGGEAQITPSDDPSSPVSDTVYVSATDIAVGTYQYISSDDSYGFAVEFTEDGAVWFYEATKDETLVQGFVGELVPTAEENCYRVPLFYVDFVPYTEASIKVESTVNGILYITQLDENALLSSRIPLGETVALTPVEGYSLSQTIIALYADQMTE